MSLKHVLLVLLLVPLPAWSDEPVDRKELERLRLQVEQMKQLLLLQDAQLRQMEQRAATASAPPAPATPMAAAAPAPAPAPVIATPPAPAPVPAVASPPAAAPVPAPAPVAPAVAAPSPMPAKAAGVDPAPYEAAVAGRVGMIRISQPPAWRVLDEQRLVLWPASDEAFLLELEQACDGLLAMQALDIETFSTRVRSGQDAVKVGGRRCLVATIKRLNASRIPKPPRR